MRDEVPDFLGGDRLVGGVIAAAGLCDEHHGLHGHGCHPAWVDIRPQLAGRVRLFHQFGQQCQQGRVRDLDLGRMLYQQAGREVGEQRALGGRVGPRGFEQQLDGDLEALERFGRGGGGGPDLVGRPAQCVLEQGQQ